LIRLQTRRYSDFVEKFAWALAACGCAVIFFNFCATNPLLFIDTDVRHDE